MPFMSVKEIFILIISGRLKIFQRVVRRADMIYHYDYFRDFTGRSAIFPGGPLHSTHHLPGYRAFPGIFLPKNSQKMVKNIHNCAIWKKCRHTMFKSVFDP
jgi:hypothetical protein